MAEIKFGERIAAYVGNTLADKPVGGSFQSAQAALDRMTATLGNKPDFVAAIEERIAGAKKDFSKVVDTLGDKAKSTIMEIPGVKAAQELFAQVKGHFTEAVGGGEGVTLASAGKGTGHGGGRGA